MSWIHFISRNFRFLSFGFGISAVLSVAQTFFISLFNDDFQAAVGLTHGELSTLYGAAMLTGSVATLFAGSLFDRLDLRVYCTINLGLTVVCAAGLAIVTSVPVLFLATFGIRFFGGSMMGLACQGSMARYFEADRGKAAAIANAGYTTGFAIFPLLGALMIDNLGWRDTWWAIAAAVAVAVIPTVLFQLKGQSERHARYLQRQRDLERVPDRNAAPSLTLAQVLRDRRFYLVLPGMLALPGILFTFQYQQLALIAEKGWHLPTFAAFYMLFAAAAFLANLAAGAVVDHYGSRRLLMWYVIPMIPALIAVGTFDHPLVIPFYMLGMGLTFGAGLVASITVWAELFGSGHIGAIRGFTMAANTTLASITMAGTGWLIDAGVTLSLQAQIAGGITLAAAIMLIAVARKLPPKHQLANA